MRCRIAGEAHRDEDAAKEDVQTWTENVSPNNRVVVNPYRKTPKTGSIKQNTSLWNPYKKTTVTEAACSLKAVGQTATVRAPALYT